MTPNRNLLGLCDEFRSKAILGEDSDEIKDITPRDVSRPVEHHYIPTYCVSYVACLARYLSVSMRDSI